MKERPILFSAPMVRAMLAGTKTQTRRVAKPQPHRNDERFEEVISTITGEVRCIRVPAGWNWRDLYVSDEAPVTFAHALRDHCPYGTPGDRLYVKEAHRLGNNHNAPAYAVRYEADGSVRGGLGDDFSKLRPSIHMPRWASRITLEIAEVRVQRLHDISEEDAKAEGCSVVDPSPHTCALDVFSDLWRSINGADSWVANPWVWAITFKRLA